MEHLPPVPEPTGKKNGNYSSIEGFIIIDLNENVTTN